jgi:phosphate transport system substrate-binding protein
MKRAISILLSLTLTAALLAGCGADKTAEDTAGEESAQLSGSVSTDGSTSMEEVIGVLGEQFQADTGVSVTYNPTGSGSGIEAVKNGSCDIGLSSRALKDEEEAAGPHRDHRGFGRHRRHRQR